MVGGADDVAAVAEPGRAGDAADRFDDRAEHAAVQQTVRLEQLRADGHGGPDLVPGRRGDLDAEQLVEPDASVVAGTHAD